MKYFRILHRNSMIIDWQLAARVPRAGANIGIKIISLGYSFSIKFGMLPTSFSPCKFEKW